MSVTHHTCTAVECDTPKCDGGFDEGTPHFETEAKALEYLIGEEGCGWSIRPDGRLLCRFCSEHADCEATGHQWGEWRPRMRWDAAAGRSIPDEDSGTEWRMCDHCSGGFEERIAGTDVIL